MVRIVPNLRAKARFQRLNLMDSSYNVPKDFDIIFCRNVLIYFDRETQEKVINKLCMHLKPGGYFFLGHSESISGIDVPLKPLKPTMFVKI
jgi:chemotaxis protein methyltransferase CheR